MAKHENLEDLFLDQLKDLASAEQQLIKALPKMAKAAQSQELKTAFTNHLKETENHVTRLKKIFQILGEPFKAKTCEAMKGLVEEGQEAIKEYNKTAVIDPSLVAAAKRVEHYEMGAYETIRLFAKELGHNDIVKLIQETLNEEIQADKLITSIAEKGLSKLDEESDEKQGSNKKSSTKKDDAGKKQGAAKKSTATSNKPTDQKAKKTVNKK